MTRTSTAKNCSVLVTEDDPGIRALLTTTLRRRRISPVLATNGAEALHLLEQQEWPVLLLDLNMPAVTGWDVIAWLAKNRHRKPNTVIVVTATERDLLRDLDPTVVNAVIFKPFDIHQLSAYVKASCELPHRDRRKSRLVGGGAQERP